MSSKSREAQEALTGLEKGSAPFEDLLNEAAKFLGTSLQTICQLNGREASAELQNGFAVYHGREEWLLRWLLKKLQDSYEGARTNHTSWRVLLFCIRHIPLPIVARILVERKFTSILQQTLESAKETVRSASRDGSDAVSVAQKEKSKSSKKRKRSGEPVANLGSSSGVRDLLISILSVMEFIVDSAKPGGDKSQTGRSEAFSAEYMRTAIRITTEDAAKILGLWLTLVGGPNVFLPNDSTNWLAPFVEIWDNRASSDNHLQEFSLNCTVPLFSLGKSIPSGLKEYQEGLIARNIIIPAKVAYEANSSSTLLGDVTRLPVIHDSGNATTIFQIAVRLIQPQGSKRRKAVDESWLQYVFSTLHSAMSPNTVNSNAQVICNMLQCAIDYKVDLELAVLQSITADIALRSDGPEVWELKNWELISTIIKVDANVFLIPDEEKNLLEALFSRVNRASLQASWSEHAFSEGVLEYCLVPLMAAFAQARNLSGFVHHWYEQLLKLEILRKKSSQVSADVFGAWEDELLQKELQMHLEASLTTQQIVQLLDWLEAILSENPGPVTVILDAISGCIAREDVVDTVGLRCYKILFDNKIIAKLDRRYKWRSWRIVSQTLAFATPQNFDELAGLWASEKSVFKTLQSEASSSNLLVEGLEPLEMFRALCSAWGNARDESLLMALVKPYLLLSLRRVSLGIQQLLQQMVSGSDLGEDWNIPRQTMLSKGSLSIALSYIHCIFVEHPKVLSLGLESEVADFKEMLQTTFLMSSSTLGQEEIQNSWIFALGSDEVINNTNLIEMMIEIMLANQTNANNPLTASKTNNSFSIFCLSNLPATILHRKHRERILQGWLTNAGEPSSELSYERTALDSAVLALKVKTLQYPMFYEGMKFEDLVKLGNSLADSSVDNPQVNLALLKELSRLTVEFVFTNIEQPRNQDYITKAFNHIHKKIKKSHEKSKHKTDYASVTLFGTAINIFNANSAAIHELEISTSSDLAKLTSSFKESLLLQLQQTLQKFRKQSAKDGSGDDASKDLLVLSILDSLSLLKPEPSDFTEMRKDAHLFAERRSDSKLGVGGRLDTFMSAHAGEASAASVLFGNKGDVSTIQGRQAIVEKTRGSVEQHDDDERLNLLMKALSNNSNQIPTLDELLCIREIIASIGDSRRHKDEDSDSSSDDEEEAYDLSVVYSKLCSNLHKTTSRRQLCLISEILELMLRTKARSITQWNIDGTLGSISVICSRNGPSIRAAGAGTIFLHLCHLFQATLNSHRLKLEGHFHLVVQALQSLLRCLFTPLPHSSAKTLKYYAPPPWLTAHARLNAEHAAAFTRLITLICDPSVSSVTRSQHNNLTSATDKAKRMAGQHMQFVLATYVKLQLEMKMLPPIREKMIPGLYAIFDTTTPELRRCISDSLDSSGRAVFGLLYKDYLKFGKWKGS